MDFDRLTETRICVFIDIVVVVGGVFFQILPSLATSLQCKLQENIVFIINNLSDTPSGTKRIAGFETTVDSL